ncbi:hypothetical protein F5Y16DRAFT_386513 [Xylariaceae sp. FL0255]|nr:hypothetical protein F5Y16DRAFT_386513 [Xylariaceae sp. FL0255]
MASASRTKDDPARELGRPLAMDLEEETGYRWPAWTVGMEMEDLWRSLHDDYNTLRIPMQCHRTFFFDVKELSTRAQNHDEFHRLMADRARNRFEEVQEALDRLCMSLITPPYDRFPHGLWPQFLDFARSMSAADLAVFLAGFEDPEKKKGTNDLLARAAAFNKPLAQPSLENAPSQPSRPPTPPISAPASSNEDDEDSFGKQAQSDLTSDAPRLPPNLSPDHQSSLPDRPLTRSSARLKARSQPPSSHDAVKRNLRPLAAGLPQRKEQKRRRRPRRKKQA